VEGGREGEREGGGGGEIDREGAGDRERAPRVEARDVRAHPSVCVSACVHARVCVSVREHPCRLARSSLRLLASEYC
jgi:hypothetical protein